MLRSPKRCSATIGKWRRSDIAAFVANWEDKAANLRVIAEQLNIGLDSLVFVDDNPVERARIREALPMVAVPEMPDDPADYVRVLADAGYFEAVTFTAEDLQRADQYAANAEREALRDGAGTMEDFLRGLEMSVVHGAFDRQDMPRVAQLINKTNQFNTTTKRYSLDDVTRVAAREYNAAVPASRSSRRQRVDQHDDHSCCRRRAGSLRDRKLGDELPRLRSRARI